MSPAIMTVQEAAEYLRAHPKTVSAKLKSGALPGRKVGKSYRIRKEDLDEYLKGDKVAQAVAQAEAELERLGDVALFGGQPDEKGTLWLDDDNIKAMNDLKRVLQRLPEVRRKIIAGLRTRWIQERVREILAEQGYTYKYGVFSLNEKEPNEKLESANAGRLPRSRAE